MIFLDEYDRLIDEVFSQGDVRYFDNYQSINLTFFLKNKGILIEDHSGKIEKSVLSKKAVEIKMCGPQVDLKQIAFQIFLDEDVTLVGFERRQPGGIADMEGTKSTIKILVECGPCRIDKGFTYLRETDTELWVISEDFNRKYWFIIKRGPNWDKCIQHFDKLRNSRLQRVKNPYDTL